MSARIVYLGLLVLALAVVVAPSSDLMPIGTARATVCDPFELHALDLVDCAVDKATCLRCM